MTPTQNPSRRVKFSTFALLSTRSMCELNGVAQWWSCFNSAPVFSGVRQRTWNLELTPQHTVFMLKVTDIFNTEFRGDILIWVFFFIGGNSQFSFLELSQSQDLGGDVTNCQEQADNITPQPDCEKHAKLGIYKCSFYSSIIYYGRWKSGQFRPFRIYILKRQISDSMLI